MRAILLLAVTAFSISLLPLSADAQLTWASPSDRVSGWQADLDSTLSGFLPRDRSFGQQKAARFTKQVHGLRESVSKLTDDQLIVRLAEAVAGAGNAHTRLYLLRNRTVLRRYPIRVWWFASDLVIVRAHPEQQDLLGARIVRIAGHSPAEAAKRVTPLYAGSPSWLRYMSSYLLTSPEVLKGAGLQSSDELTVTVQTRDGHQKTARLAPMPLERTDQPTEAWWDLSPTNPGRQGPWVSVLADTASLPLYLKHLDRYYWFERTRDVLYVQYNRAQDQPDGETVAAFSDRLMQDLERDPPRKLVIDLRFNTGGNLQLADALLRRIAALPLAQERGRLFVISGRSTFSAGITAVAVLRQLTKAEIVGEPVGDGLDFWAEGGNILLRHTGLTLHYANGFHSYSSVEHPEFRPYAYDLSVQGLGPDIHVDIPILEYFAGVDGAIEAILRR